ncbi:MAG: TonB-dependent receptor [Glaciimonas sp.]|nr:TonB-dependent receptor [Glaciimonas sp.]
MSTQRTLISSAVLSALVSFTTSVNAQQAAQVPYILEEVVVTASPFNHDENTQILTPAKVLKGAELRNKLSTSLGDTLSQELGVSASSFGAGASRPIIRGMEGPRVKILQNGMSVADASSLSNDHATATEAATAQQIEILRGPATLLYGSGAIGGLINVVNNRIPTTLPTKANGEIEMRYSTVDQDTNTAFSLNGASGAIGLHLDGNLRKTANYKIPGNAIEHDPHSASGRLGNSFTRNNSFAAGASYIAHWGHIGASVATLNDHYGIPTEEKAYIDLRQNRYDIDALINNPFANFDTFKFKFGYTDYQHIEKGEDGTPHATFANKAAETRWELSHKPLFGWRGTFGVQTEETRFSALSAQTGIADTVPKTTSSSLAAFLVEERNFGPILASAGLRLESVKRTPDGAGNDSSTNPDRKFNLTSYSVGGMWGFAPGYSVGPTISIAQRAPTVEELYSHGPHEATATFDIGNPAMKKETSQNIELSLQKTTGLIRWKTNLFQNHVRNYVYGRMVEKEDDHDHEHEHARHKGDHGHDHGDFTERFWTQADATIRGAEAEISYNLRGSGFSVRGFADTTRGKLTNLGNLPLQPASRVGMDINYRQGAWRSGVSVLHAQQQNRIATFEHRSTPRYTKVDANLSYTQHINGINVTWFALLKNAFNQDIRLATSVLKDAVPLAGRNLILGMRGAF